MFGEREAFEKAIDADPLEATNHLAYADWLEENGEPDEAAFRRAMGEWVGDKRERINEIQHHFGYDGFGAGGSLGWPTGVLSGNPSDPMSGFSYPRRPTGTVNSGYPHVRGEEGPPHWPAGFTTRSENHVRDATETKSPYFLRWDTYRGMEQAMREAFMKNRPKKNQRRYILPRRRFSRK